MSRQPIQPNQPSPYEVKLRAFATNYRAGLASDWTGLRAYMKGPRWKSDRRWLVFVTAFGIIALAAMYASIAANLTPPAQVISGAKGIEILDRDGQIIHAFDDEPGSSRVVPLEEISPHLINA